MSRKKSIEKVPDFGPIVISPNQLNMFPDYGPTVPTPPRPTNNTLDKEPVFEAIAREVMEWADESEDEDRLETYLKITKKVFGIGNFNDDAYELAKGYERAGCQPNVNLVNLLDDVSNIVHVERKRQVAEWVKKYGVKSTFNIADQICRENAPSSVGTVHAVYHDTAEIGVKWNNLSNSISILPQEYFILKK
jgi:hypothetical protein